MKPFCLIIPALLVFGSCAPKGIVLQTGAPTGRPATPRESTLASNPQPTRSEPEPRLPTNDGIGLLDPSRLTQLPESQEMRPTAGDDKERPVIAEPPGRSKDE